MRRPGRSEVSTRQASVPVQFNQLTILRAAWRNGNVMSPRRISVFTSLLFVIFVSGLPFGGHAQAVGTTLEIHSRDDLIKAVNGAQPGTRILIAPGEYRGGLSFSKLQGAEGKPIVLAALDVTKPPTFVGGAYGIHLRNPGYVELHHLILDGSTGNGLNIDDGGDANRPANNIVLRGLRVTNIGPKGNRDGIKLSGVDDFRIEACIIERWGDSGSAIDMVGCHDGEIEGCEFRYRNDIFGNGVQTKGGSANIAIRRCRFENAGGRAVNLGGSTGRDYFRPSGATFEARNITVEDCTFIGSMSPIAFVGVDGAIVRHNTIYRPTQWVVRILQESQGDEFIRCRNGLFANNIIAFRSDEVRTVVNVGSGTAPDTFRFMNNHWFCLDNPQRSSQLGLPTPEQNGTYGVDPVFRDPKTGDLRLSRQSPVRNAGVRAID